MKITEAQLQQNCVIWFNNTYCLKNSNPKLLMFSIPNETAMEIRGVLKRFKVSSKIIDSSISIVMKTLKATGFKAGISDTIVLLPNGITLFIEFKTETGTQSKSQKEFESTVVNLNHKYYICRCIEQFKEIIQSNLDNV